MKIKNDQPSDDYSKNLPQKIKETLYELQDKIKLFNTFDLLAAVFHYHQTEDESAAEYRDFRGDKNFFVIEIIALACLKNSYQDISMLDLQNFYTEFDSLKNTTLSYVRYKTEERMDSYINEMDIIEDPAAILQREALMIRNPALPDHHLIFSESLYNPISKQLTAIFGFNPTESVILRKELPNFLAGKYNEARHLALSSTTRALKQVQYFQKKGIVPPEALITEDDFKELAETTYDKQRIILRDHFLIIMHYNLGEIYSFTAQEFSTYTRIELNAVQAFLTLHSSNFPAQLPQDEIFTTDSILKSRPLVHHNGRYLLLSSPLLFWATDIHYEEAIKRSNKLSGRYSKIKHDFTLSNARLLLMQILPQSHFFPENLFYTIGQDRFETDTIFAFDTVLFIVEVKGHRISSKARSGNRQRTNQHLKEIVKESYDQGIRALEYILSEDKALFKTDKGKPIVIEKDKYDEIVLLSLTLEPIGNLAMAIKATNTLGYFKQDYFPWVLSLYDLQVIADLIENPFIFIQYIRRRKAFLSVQQFQIHEELDLLAYFLKNGLIYERFQEDSNEMNFVTFMPNTDAINSYYLYKFGHISSPFKKPNIYLPDEIQQLLNALARSPVEHKVKIAVAILSLELPGLIKFSHRLMKAKKDFIKDGQLHDASLYNTFLRIGVTYMAHPSKEFMEKKLAAYCLYKYESIKTKIWVGLGDTSRLKDYEFMCMCYINDEEPKLL